MWAIRFQPRRSPPPSAPQLPTPSPPCVYGGMSSSHFFRISSSRGAFSKSMTLSFTTLHPFVYVIHLRRVGLHRLGRPLPFPPIVPVPDAVFRFLPRQLFNFQSCSVRPIFPHLVASNPFRTHFLFNGFFWLTLAGRLLPLTFSCDTILSPPVPLDGSWRCTPGCSAGKILPVLDEYSFS